MDQGSDWPSVELWLAEHDPQPGVPVAEKVQQQLDASHAMFVFLTEASHSAPYVQQEIGWALKAKMPVLPVVQTGISGDQLAMLQGLEYIPFDFQHPEEGRTALLNHLQRLAQAKATSDDLRTALLLVGALLVLGAVVQSSG